MKKLFVLLNLLGLLVCSPVTADPTMLALLESQTGSSDTLEDILAALGGAPAQEHTTAASPLACRLSNGASFYNGASDAKLDELEAKLDSIIANQTNGTQTARVLDDLGTQITGAALGAGNNPWLAVLRNPDTGENMGGSGAPVHVQISGGTGDTLTLGTSALFATLSDGGSETVSGMDTIGSASGILVTVHADNPGVLVIRWTDADDIERLVKEYQIPGRSGPNTLSDAIRSDIRGVKFKIEFYDTLDGLANNVDAQAYLSSKSLTPSDRPKALGRVDTMDAGTYRNFGGDPVSDVTPVEVVESLAGDIHALRTTNNTTRYIGVYAGLVGEEVEVTVIGPAFQGELEVTGLVKGARVSLKAIEGIYGTGDINSGDMSLEFYGH